MYPHTLYFAAPHTLIVECTNEIRTAIHSISIDGFFTYVRYTDVKLELFTEPDHYLFCEKAVRGGVSQISHKYQKANNKYMADYDETEESSFLSLLDANNLKDTSFQF